MNILVTGGAGFIGSNLTSRLLREGHHVYCIDDFNDFYDPLVKRGNISEFKDNENYRLIECDITDYKALEQVFSSNHIEKIIHLAARAGVRPSVEDPILYEQVNVGGTLNLLELSRKHDVNHFIFGSSSSVYGINSKVPFAEDDPIEKPISPYAASKRAAELFCYTYNHLYAINVTCLRFFTVYGPRQRPDLAIHKFTKLMSQGEEIPFFGDGKSSRDYTFIDDIVDGVMAATNKAFTFEIINLGNSYPVELGKLVDLISSELGVAAKINRLPNQPGDVPITYAKIDKAKKLLNYQPKVPIEEGIKRFISWFKDSRK